MDKLGRVQPVDLRSVFPNEASDFTPWLASTEGLALLSEVIGLEIEPSKIEARVGDYRTDILASVAEEGDVVQVVIENQLSKTDHDHLGKLVTYAAGHGAGLVVWIAEAFSDEHREAMDWLNQNTPDVNFFGLQIELVRIGESAPAPQFKVVSSPNQWAKALRAAGSRELSETKLEQLRFWEDLKQYAELRDGLSVNISRKPLPQHWYNVSVGRSNFKIALTVHSVEGRVGCEIFIRGDEAKPAFDILHEQRREIESELNTSLDWQRLDEKIGSRIALYKSGEFDDEDQREELIDWLVSWADQFYTVFGPRIRRLQVL